MMAGPQVFISGDNDELVARAKLLEQLAVPVVEVVVAWVFVGLGCL